MQRDQFVCESRRSVVTATHAAAAAGQPEAVQAGLDIMKRGGNAADAAVAMAAVLNVCQPTSTGIGGDAFCLFYNAKSKSVKGLNGSGRSPAGMSLDYLASKGYSASSPWPMTHGATVTVPGAAAAWVDTVEHFGSGRVTMNDILEPAIGLADNGVPIAQVTSYFWNADLHTLLSENNPHGVDMCIDGRAPKWGEIFRNKHLANTFRSLAKDGKKGFYEGRIAQAIVDAIEMNGGVMTLDDLSNHHSDLEEPISTEYKGTRLYEIGPNSQGIVALMALNIIKTLNIREMGHNSAEYLHTLIEALRLSFKDAMEHVADPSKVHVPTDQLLSESYAAERRKLINEKKALDVVPSCNNIGPPGSDTVYLTVVDHHGNACSFINSNFKGFGTGITPKGCGFTLQNRGLNFSLKRDHPNCVSPNKRPYHTIIPAMVTDDNTGELLCSYGVMGAFMQPQGHVQVLLNMLEFGMNPQEALDKPRFCVGGGHEGPFGPINFEEGISPDIINNLRDKGHEVAGPISGHGRAIFGRGHVITRGAWWLPKSRTDTHDGKDVLWAGSDPRNDGLALGF